MRIDTFLVRDPKDPSKTMLADERTIREFALERVAVPPVEDETTFSTQLIQCVNPKDGSVILADARTIKANGFELYKAAPVAAAPEPEPDLKPDGANPNQIRRGPNRK